MIRKLIVTAIRSMNGTRLMGVSSGFFPPERVPRSMPPAMTPPCEAWDNSGGAEFQLRAGDHGERRLFEGVQLGGRNRGVELQEGSTPQQAEAFLSRAARV